MDANIQFPGSNPHRCGNPKSRRHSLAAAAASCINPLLVVIGATLAIAPPGHAEQERSLLNFSTSNQSLWGAGSSAGASFDRFLGVEWDESNIRILNIGSTKNGSTGVDLFADTDGKFGVDFNFGMHSGTVDAFLPYEAGFGFNRSTLELGSSTRINAFYDLRTTASFNTSVPKFEMAADLVFELDAGIKGRGCVDLLFDSVCKNIPRKELVDFKETAELFAVNRDNDLQVRLLGSNPGTGGLDVSHADSTLSNDGDKFTRVQLSNKVPLAGGSLDLGSPLALEAKFPRIDSIGRAGPDNVLRGGGSDEFLRLYADIDAIAGEIIKKLPPLGISGKYKDPTGAVKVSGSVDLLDLDFDPTLSLDQAFELLPELLVELDFNRDVRISTDGGQNFELIRDHQTKTLLADADFDLLWDNNSPLEVTPTYSLNAVFKNKTDLDIDLNLTLDILKASFQAEVLGIDLTDGKKRFGPLFRGSCEAGECGLSIGDIDIPDMFRVPDPAGLGIFNNSFVLGGFGEIVGETLVLDNREAIWLGEFDSNERDDWTHVNAWKNNIVGDDDRDAVLDIEAVRIARNKPNLAETTVVIQNNDKIEVDDLSISDGIIVEVLNGALNQSKFADRFSNQGTVKVLSNGNLNVGGDLLGGGEILMRGGDLDVLASSGSADLIDQTIRGYGDVSFTSRARMHNESLIAAEGGLLRVTATGSDGGLFVARNNSTLRLRRTITTGSGFPSTYFFVDGSELRSEGSGKIVASDLTLSGNAINNGTLEVSDTLRLGTGPDGIDVTNNGSITADIVAVSTVNDRVTVGGAGTVSFTSRLEAQSGPEALTIGQEQVWTGKGTLAGVDIVNLGEFNLGAGSLTQQSGTFTNRGTLKLNDRNLSFEGGEFATSGGVIETNGGKLVFEDGATINGPVNGRINVGSGRVEFHDPVEQWRQVRVDNVLDNVELILAPGGDVMLEVPGIVIGTQLVSATRYIDMIGANGILRVSNGRNYRPSPIFSTLRTVRDLDVAGLLELDGGTLELNDNSVDKGELSILTGGEFQGSGVIDANLINDGLVTIENSELEVKGTVSGGGEYIVRNGGSIDIQGCGTIAGFCPLFGPANGSTALANAGVTVDGRVAAASFTINAELDELRGTTVRLLGENSDFTVEKCGFLGSNCDSVSMADALDTLTDARLDIAAGREFNSTRNLQLNDGSAITVENATLNAAHGLSVNDTSELILDGGLLNIGAGTVLALNGAGELTGTGRVAGDINNAALIRVAGGTLALADGSVSQSPGGRVDIDENAAADTRGVLRLESYDIGGGNLAIHEGGILHGTGTVLDANIDVTGAALALAGDVLHFSGGQVFNHNTLRADGGGELRLTSTTVHNNAVLEVNSANAGPDTTALVTLDNSLITGGDIRLLSINPAEEDTGARAVLRGSGEIRNTDIFVGELSTLTAARKAPGQQGELDVFLDTGSVINDGVIGATEESVLRLFNGALDGGEIASRGNGALVELHNVHLSNVVFSNEDGGIILDVAASQFDNLTNPATFDIIGHATFDGFINNTGGTLFVRSNGVATINASSLFAEGVAGALVIEENGSAQINGTRVNGNRIELANNAVLTFADGATLFNSIDETGFAPLALSLRNHAALNVQSGSIIRDTSLVALGHTAGDDVVVTLNNGTLATTDLFVGGTAIAAVAGATVNIGNGGELLVDNEFGIWQGGTVNLDGGLLSVGGFAQQIASDGVFNWSGGTVRVTAPEYIAPGTSLFGMPMTLTAQQTLDVVNALRVDGDAEVHVDGGVLRGGSITLHDDGLVDIGTNGLVTSSDININGGTLHVGAGGLLEGGENADIEVNGGTLQVAQGRVEKINSLTLRNGAAALQASGVNGVVQIDDTFRVESGANATFGNLSQLEVGDGDGGLITVDSGTLTFADGAVLRGTGIAPGLEVRGTGLLQIRSDSEVSTLSSISVFGDATASFVEASAHNIGFTVVLDQGLLEVGRDAAVSTGQVAVARQGRVEVTDGGVLSGVGVFSTGTNHPDLEQQMHLLVSGAGSELNLDSQGGIFLLGATGPSRARIGDGGAVNIRDVGEEGFPVGFNVGLDIGPALRLPLGVVEDAPFLARSTLLIDGAGATFNVDGESIASYIGSSTGFANAFGFDPDDAAYVAGGNGALHILNGGQLIHNAQDTAQLFVADKTGSLGEVVVMGGESKLDAGTLLALGSDGAGTPGGEALLTVAAGGVVLADTISIGENSELTGDGGTLIGNTVIAGTLNPGASPGILSFEGDLELLAASRTVIELGGYVPVVEHDVIDVSGEFSLNGLLEIRLVDGFQPLIGDTFDLFRAGELSGAFTALIFPQLFSGNLGMDSSGNGLLTITASPVPLPAGVWMLLSGLLFLCTRGFAGARASAA